MLKDKKIFLHELKDEVLEIKLFGEIDHHGAVRVRSEIDGLIFEHHPKKTVLELSEISFMDSSGLGLIMGRYSLMKELGGSLILRSPSKAVMKILRLAGMERIVKIEKADMEEKGNEQD